ncbi:hypothetical protein CYMTET_28240 [Cymbomonas tetramitiformis]|uniref:Uncharacterized protein n=1 Tax=Cymbomonas tetramitiformis TaxID=36881 RepID=A0AAE0FN93_9CHLO|nr:hypothetical protein CYMTET_28240 [Cymbomonas tetramitiformis]
MRRSLSLECLEPEPMMHPEPQVHRTRVALTSQFPMLIILCIPPFKYHAFALAFSERLEKAKKHDATHFDEEELINTDAEEANTGDEDELSEDEDAEEGRRPKAPRAQKKYDEVNGKLQELRAAIGSAVGDALSETELKSAVITHEDVLKDIETFQRNYGGWLAPDIAKFNEGLARRGEIRLLEQKCAALESQLELDDLSEQRRSELMQGIHALETQILATWQHLVAHDQAVYIEDNGFFFVEFWLCPDLKAMKGLLGISSGAGVMHPCPCCDVTKEHISDLTKNWNERIDLNPVLPIPMSRIRPCGMHLIHRVSEKILQLLINLVWSIQKSDKWSQEMRDNHARLLEFLNAPIHENGMFINGGYCKIQISPKDGKYTPGKIPMNGTECLRFEKLFEKALGMIEGLSEDTMDKLLKVGEVSGQSKRLNS